MISLPLSHRSFVFTSSQSTLSKQAFACSFSWKLLPRLVIGALCTFSVEYLDIQHDYCYPLEPVWSEITITWPKAPHLWDSWSDKQDDYQVSAGRVTYSRPARLCAGQRSDSCCPAGQSGMVQDFITLLSLAAIENLQIVHFWNFPCNILLFICWNFV